MSGPGECFVNACGQWVSRHRLLAAAIWIVLAHVTASLSPLAFWVVPAIALLAALRIGKPWVGAAWALCVLLAVGVGAWREQVDGRRAVQLSQAATSVFAGKLLADPRGDGDFWQAPVRLTDGPVGMGAKVWWQGRGELPVEGSRVSGSGRFHLPQAARNPGEFDRHRWMSQQGLVAEFRQQFHEETQVSTPAWSSRLAEVRGGLRHAISRGLDENSDAAKVIGAVVLGRKPTGSEELLEDFLNSGSMHVFSVSGLHVGMVAVLVWMVAALSGISRRWLVLPVIALIFAYAWLTGANAPAVRAAWMAAVFLGAFCFRRRPDLPNALGAVLLVMLLWDVRQLAQPSVQLSYGVVGAIAFGLPWTTRWFSLIGAAPLHMPVAEVKGLQLMFWRLRQWTASTLAVSSAASFGAAPLTLWHFGLVTPVSIVASLLVLPLVFVVMALAMCSMLLSPLEVVSGPVMTAVNRINAVVAEGCAKAAGVMAHLPGGHWRTGVERGPLLLVFDLKQGDGAACWLPQQGSSAALIDCGGRGSFMYPLRSSLVSLGIKPDAVVLTHPDGGHVGGGHAVWREFPIRQVLMPVSQARSPAYRTWQRQAQQDGVSLIAAETLEGLPMGEGARIEWLHLPDPNNQQLAADHRVLVMRLHWQGWKILWYSDAGSVAERAMLESGRDLRADVIVAGSHRSDLSLSDEFVEAVRPRAIVIGNDDYPEGESVDPIRLKRWRDSGIGVFDQAEAGAVSLRPVDGGLLIEGHVNRQQLRLK